jgi:hypothetical protein
MRYVTRRQYNDHAALSMFVAIILWIILGFIRAYLEPGVSYIEPMVGTTLLLIGLFAEPIWWVLSCQWIKNPTIRLTVQALLAAGLILWLEFSLLASLKLK